MSIFFGDLLKIVSSLRSRPELGRNPADMLKFNFWVLGGFFTLITLATNSFRLVNAKPTWPTEEANDFPILSIENQGKISTNNEAIGERPRQQVSLIQKYYNKCCGNIFTF